MTTTKDNHPSEPSAHDIVKKSIDDTIRYYKKKALGMPRNVEHEDKMYAAFSDYKEGRNVYSSCLK